MKRRLRRLVWRNCRAVLVDDCGTQIGEPIPMRYLDWETDEEAER